MPVPYYSALSLLPPCICSVILHSHALTEVRGGIPRNASIVLGWLQTILACGFVDGLRFGHLLTVQ